MGSDLRCEKTPSIAAVAPCLNDYMKLTKKGKWNNILVSDETQNTLNETSVEKGHHIAIGLEGWQESGTESYGGGREVVHWGSTQHGENHQEVEHGC